MNNRTYGMIKPEAVKNNSVGGIIKMITEAGFKIIGMKMTHFGRDKAGVFYIVHEEKSFYGELIDYITSGPVVAIALEKENAVEDFRKLLGATNPLNADEGTIRKIYGASIQENAVHGSDSDANAKLEIAMMFDSNEIFL